MAISQITLLGEEINNFINLIATNRHYTVTIEDPSYWITSGLLDVVQEFSKYRRRMEWVLAAPNRLLAYHAGNYVGHLRAGKVGRGQDMQAIFGAPDHSRPRTPMGLDYNEEYSSSVKTAAKKASEMFVQMKPAQIIAAFMGCVRAAFSSSNPVVPENRMNYELLDQFLLNWKREIIDSDSSYDGYNADLKLLRLMTYYLVNSSNESEANDDWDAPEKVFGADAIKVLMNKFQNKDRYTEEYQRIQRNQLRFENISHYGAVMCVNRIGKPTIIQRSTVPQLTLKVPLVIYDHCQTVEELPVNIQEAYHGVRLAGLHRYVEGYGMYMNDGTTKNTGSRVLGTCVWLDPNLYIGYDPASLS